MEETEVQSDFSLLEDQAKARQLFEDLILIIQDIRFANKVIKETSIDPRTGQRVTRTNESEDVTPYRNGSGFFNTKFNSQPDYSGNAADEPRWWSRLKGIFSQEDDHNDSPGSGFIKQNNLNTDRNPSNYYPQNDYYHHGFEKQRDPFDEIGFMSPFKMMREFERMFENDFDFHQEPSGYRSHSRDEDEFIDGFFGHMGNPFNSAQNRGGFFSTPFNEFEPNQPRYAQRFPPPSGYPNSSYPVNNNFNPPKQHNEPQAVAEPEVQKTDTAASRARAKIYDV